MALFHPASRRWADRHFVLTKSGFLHLFASAEELEPLDALALHRCEFESSSEDATVTISESQGPTHVRLALDGRGWGLEHVRSGPFALLGCACATISILAMSQCYTGPRMCEL